MGTRIVLGWILLALALYCGLDPFNHSSISGFPNFVSVEVKLPDKSEIPTIKDSLNLLQNSDVKLLGQIQGPESLVFDPNGRGPSVCDPQPNPLGYIKKEHICGRPLGLRFNKKTGELYIADAYFGLMKVGPEGGVATSLVTEAEGVPLTFTNDLDIDDEGNVYFTDSSAQYQRRHFMQLVFSGEDGGRVLKYDPVTKETTVLLKNIQFPNGLTLSKDGSFFLFCEGSIGRLSRYWLKGEKAGTSEIFAILPGFPDNIRTNKDGDFWVALHCRRSWTNHLLAATPRLRNFSLKLPIKAKYQFMVFIGGWPHGIIVKYNPEGEIVQILEDSPGKVVKAVSEVEEKDGKLWIGSVLMPFVAVYDLGSSSR
uniref:Strictosidine synthase conserved region domain-containing protein n=1 Tax=Chenopodium quinoa TaxID=63459 RepID=A0A803LXK7_CHEQI